MIDSLWKPVPNHKWIITGTKSSDLTINPGRNYIAGSHVSVRNVAEQDHAKAGPVREKRQNESGGFS